MTTETTAAVTATTSALDVGPTYVSMLNDDDICDRCGAKAYVLALFDGGSLLTFCGHHGRAFSLELNAKALVVYDETSRIG